MRSTKSYAFLLGMLAACSQAQVQPDAGSGPVVTDQRDASAPLLDAGRVKDASPIVEDAAVEDAQVSMDAMTTPPDAGAPDVGPQNRDCSAFAQAGMDVCEATPTDCRLVFNNGEGCAAACAVGGLACSESYENDGDSQPPVCGPHPNMTPLGCAPTGHVSDYCVCSEPVVMPPAGCRAETLNNSGTTNVSSTIVIDQPGVYDYQNVLHIWTGGGQCNQTENQPYILRIAASNVTVRNFYYQDAPDGIHIGTSANGQGHSSGQPISNIVLENVVGRACEDALTTQYGVGQVTIRDSMFLPNANSNYRDKLLQLNFGDVTLERTTFYGGGSSLCLMFKGGQQLHIKDSCFKNCDRAINGSTIHGIVGLISTSRSDLLSERNEGHHPARSATFWDPWKFFTGEGDVHIISVQDQIFDRARTDMEQGATLTIQ